MIVGALAGSNRAASSIVERISGCIPGSEPRVSVSDGVAVACWQEEPVPAPIVFAGDYAHVGLALDAPGGPELRGDFAMVARTNGRLRMARGRFGGRPLFWMQRDGATIACSRLLPLATLLRGQLDLNIDHLLTAFFPGLWWGKRPLPFHGIRCVETNTSIEAGAGGDVNIARGQVVAQPELEMSERDLAELVREEFRAAVARQTRGARTVGVLCGGGVDSSNLLATAVHNARAHAGPPVVPLAKDYGGPGDDRPHMVKLCEHLKIEPLRVRMAEGAPFAGLERIVDATTHFTGGPASNYFAEVARFREKSVDLVLMGEVSEYLFNAIPAVFGHFLLRSPLKALWCAARYRSIDPSINETRGQVLGRLVAGPLARLALPASTLEWRRRLRWKNANDGRVRDLPWAGPRLIDYFRALRQHTVESDDAFVYSQRDRIVRMASSSSLAANTESQARWELATGMPLRFPYLDDSFALWLGRMPSAAMFAGARERGLLRESMEGIVPDSVRYRVDKARPYDGMTELFVASGGTDSLCDLLSMREMDRMGIVDARKYRECFTAFARNPGGASPLSW